MMNVNSMTKLALLVGGGPAPGINGVISAVTLEANDNGIEVLGIEGGFQWLAQGDSNHQRRLITNEVKAIHVRGGSILGTSRVNPARSSHEMENVLRVLRGLGVTALVTIGGDDTAYSASQVHHHADGTI